VTVAEQFGRNLLRYRKLSGLSQEEIGFAASVHPTHIGMLERGIRQPRAETIVKLGAVLEVSANDLLEGITWEPGSVRVGRFRKAGEP
jgi:transcriptional regulator with XRE-family HTH domain